MIEIEKTEQQSKLVRRLLAERAGNRTTMKTDYHAPRRDG
jgi:hypothetical protein